MPSSEEGPILIGLALLVVIAALIVGIIIGGVIVGILWLVI